MRASAAGMRDVSSRVIPHAVDECDQLLRRHHAEALRDEFVDLVPVSAIVEHQAHGVSPPSQHEERVTDVAQHLQLLQCSAKREDDQRICVVHLEAEDVCERPLPWHREEQMNGELHDAHSELRFLPLELADSEARWPISSTPH